ncbi:VirB4-like conjugal transfer ATPase, CD1110 family, partial [Coprococcus comes]
MEFERDHFKIGDRYGRVLYMQDYASYVKDDMISELCDFSRNLMLSIDILPVPTDEAVREIQNRLLGVETNVTNWQRRQNANNNFSAIVPYDMELQRKETKEMLDDLTTRDQRMMFGILTMVHLADSKKQLDSDTELLLSIARKHLCQMATLKWQQVDGLNTVLPYGLRKINALRTLTTESTAVLIPFHTQEILQPGGIYYGQNAVSKNLLVADRKKLMNGNSFRLGVSGSGKSFSAKEEIVHLALSTDDDILILDPESEFTKLVEALGGQVVKVSATSDNHLNAMDMDAAYGNEKNPLIEKSEFILSVFEQLVGAGNLSAKEKSILDRCAADVYRDYIRSGYTGEVPTLKDMYRQLMLQPEEEARGLALSSELFINGSLNTFAQPTNVNKKNRIM